MAQSIVEAVFDHAKTQPDKYCLIDEREAVTYFEYTKRIEDYADKLSELGVKRGDRVLVEASQTIDFLAIELALHLLGAIFVPVEYNCVLQKMIQFAKRVEAILCITEQKKEWPLTVSEKVISVDEFKEMSQHDGRGRLDFPKAEDVSEILFTTGTTGAEKGITVTHENDIKVAENVIYGIKMESDNIEMIIAPVNHAFGLRRYKANMLCGGTAVLMSAVTNTKFFFHCLDYYKANAIASVPTSIVLLLRLIGNKLGEYNGKIRYLQSAAAYLMDADQKKLRQLLPDARLYNFYGSTESGCSAIYDFNKTINKSHCIGKATCNAEIFLTDDNRIRISTANKSVGLLAIKGKMNMKGYWNDTQGTEKYLNDGCVYTNDEAYFDEDGDIILLGRKGDVINVGGRKVSPEEIEEAALKIPSIADCACVPLTDGARGQVPKLFVQIKKGSEFDSIEISRSLREQLESYKLPEQIEQIETIPRSFNGKILRKKLMK